LRIIITGLTLLIMTSSSGLADDFFLRCGEIMGNKSVNVLVEETWIGKDRITLKPVGKPPINLKVLSSDEFNYILDGGGWGYTNSEKGLCQKKTRCSYNFKLSKIPEGKDQFRHLTMARITKNICHKVERNQCVKYDKGEELNSHYCQILK